MKKRLVVLLAGAVVLSAGLSAGCLGTPAYVRADGTAVTTSTGGSEPVAAAAGTEMTVAAGLAGSVMAVPEGYSKEAETEYLELFYRAEKPAIIVLDKSSGYLWSSSVLDADIGKDTNLIWKNAMNSLFIFQYTDFKNQTVLTNSTAETSQASIVKIKDGFCISFDFTNLKISLEMNIWIDGKSLNILIPENSLTEAGSFGLVNVEILPFLGAAGDQEKGYVFYPDGSGALMYFKDIPHPGASKYAWNIFGSDDPKSLFVGGGSTLQASLPVFGAKIGDSAFLAVVGKGNTYTTINLSQSGYILNANRISADFRYRRLYNAAVNLDDVNNPQGKNVLKLENELLKIDHEVKYLFLSGDDANYSGMANAYREHLISSGGISRKISAGDPVGIGIDLFMGIKEERILFDKYIAMTTFKQAESMIDQIRSAGVENMQVNLVGWEREGYLTGRSQLPAAGGLGGSKGLRELAGFTKKLGIPLTLQVNAVEAIRKYGGFSVRNDIVYDKTGFAVTDQYQNRFLLNPVKAYNSFTEDYLPELVNYGVSGISFESIGSIVYHDYNSRYAVNREEAVKYWQSFMADSQKKLGFAAVSGGNAYMLGCADRLLDIPDTDSGCFFTDETIPFYQMVVHGILPYSSGPCNLFYDFEKQKLKWVEYGYMPYFMLTYEKPQLLKYTKYNQLFNSDYREWISQVADIYHEFNTRLGGVWGQVIIKHEQIRENLYQVTYDGGTCVYINYSSSLVEVEGRSVKGLDYLVVEQGGREK